MVRRFALRLSVLAICAWPAAAQGPASTGSSFTAADMLEINSWNVADLTRDGAWLAVTNAPRRNQLGGDFHRDTDPTYVRQSTARVWAIETATGRRVAVLPEAQTVRGATWSPDGERLALFLYRGGVFEPIIWDRRTGRSTTVKIPAGRYVAENSELRWTDDGGRLVFSLRSEAWRGEAAAHFGSLVRGPVAVQVSSEPFLSWEALRRRSTLRSVVAWDVRSGRLEDLLPTTPLTSWNLTTDGGTLTWNEDITQKTDYEATFGAETKLMARHGGGESTTVFASLKGLSISWAPDGRHYAWTREGRIYLASVDDTTSRQVAGPTGTDRPAPGDTAAVRSRASERFSVVRFSDDGSELIVSNPEGIWFLNPQSGAKEMFLATDTATTAPRYAVLAWPAKGRQVFLSYASRTAWERGIMRYDRDTKQLEPVVRDARQYAGLRFSRDGQVAILNVAESNRPADIFISRDGLRTMSRLVETNPQLADKGLGTTRLLEYLDADGRLQYGVAHLPAGHREGMRYPTVFIIYETFFDDTFDPTAALLNANGYLVVKPSVTFETGYPWEAWLKGVNAAATHIVQLGIADSTRMGVQGTSYGGYATNLLITRTNRFKAAINISGKVDMVSFYTDSPRLGVRNINAAEKTQDRLGATLWDAPLKYIEHSAIFYADRIKTPLLLLTGDQDHNVPAGNSREMYYALRRLGRNVTWANYMNGGHGVPMTTESDFYDFHQRMVGWYEKYLAKPSTTNAASGGGLPR